MNKNSLKKLVFVTLLLMGVSLSTKVEASNQGPYIKDGSIVQITKKNYEMWQNFGWKYKNNTNNVYNKTFEARGRYQHKNGQTYYSLFDNKGNWQGYLNSKATKKTSRQGHYISDGRYVKITKGNYEIWQNFSWKLRNNTNNVYGQTFQARGRYQHFNGSTYYSLYDNKGTWYGYLNAGATQKTNAQGNYISDGRYVQITKNYELWQNFNWKKKGNGASHYNKSVQARGKYQHFNGNTYYSLFDMNGTWLGYINASATKPYQPKNTESTKIVNKDTEGRILSLTRGYKYVSESTDGGQTKKQPNGDIHIVFTKTVIWEVDQTIQNPSDYGGKYTSDSELIVGESGGTLYSGVGNTGATFPTLRDASMFALNTIADSGRGGTYTTWQVKFKQGTIAYTTSVNLK